MKCPNCDIEMAKVYKWIEHPGPGGRMIGHLGPPLYYKCKLCGTKIETKNTGRGNLKKEQMHSNERGLESCPDLWLRQK